MEPEKLQKLWKWVRQKPARLCLILCAILITVLVVYLSGFLNEKGRQLASPTSSNNNSEQGFTMNAKDISNLQINYNMSTSATSEAIKAFEIRVNEMNDKVELTRDEVHLLAQALKDLDERTTGIEKLPDGRTRVGSFISGKPSVVIREHNESIEDFNQGRYGDALKHSQEAIKAYEDTKLKIGTNLSTGDLSGNNLSKIFMLAAVIAQRLKKTSLAYDYANKSVEISPNSRNYALLSTALNNLGKYCEALVYINRARQSEPNNAGFIKLQESILTECNNIKKKE